MPAFHRSEEEAGFPHPWHHLKLAHPPPLASGWCWDPGLNRRASGGVKAQRKTGFNSATGTIQDLRLTFGVGVEGNACS